MFGSCRGPGIARCAGLVALAALAGCGAEARDDASRAAGETAAKAPTAQAPQSRKRESGKRCTTARGAPGYRTCETRSHRFTIERRSGGTWRVIAREPAGDVQFGMSNGFWRALWLSPDGTTLLGQWSTECEVRYAFFVPAAGGRPRSVTGERDWKRRAPKSIGLGWSADGRARVKVLESGCSPDFERPGVYLIDPDTGEAELVRPLTGS